MKQVGSVEIPQEAFLAVLQVGLRTRSRVSRRSLVIQTSVSRRHRAHDAAARAAGAARAGGRRRRRRRRRRCSRTIRRCASVIVYDKRGADARRSVGFAGAWRRALTRATRTTRRISRRARCAAALLALVGGHRRARRLRDVGGTLALHDAASRTATIVHHAARLLSLATPERAASRRRRADAAAPLSRRGGARRGGRAAATRRRRADEPLIALAPGSVWATKRWPYYRRARASARGRTTASSIVGGRGDRALARGDRRRAVPQRASTPPGKLSLLASAELIGAVRGARDERLGAAASRVGDGHADGRDLRADGAGVRLRAAGAERTRSPGHDGLACRPCDRHGPQTLPARPLALHARARRRTRWPSARALPSSPSGAPYDHEAPAVHHRRRPRRHEHRRRRDAGRRQSQQLAMRSIPTQRGRRARSASPSASSALIEGVIARRDRARPARRATTFIGVGIGAPGPLDREQRHRASSRRISAGRTFRCATASQSRVQLADDARQRRELRDARRMVAGRGARRHERGRHDDRHRHRRRPDPRTATLYHGASDVAGEIGHTTIDSNGRHCKCGNYGCLEAYASGPAIADARARGARARGRRVDRFPRWSTAISKRSRRRPCTTPRRQGDAVASEIVRDTARYLGAGIANLLNIFNPDVVVRRRRRDAGGRCAVRAAARRSAAPRVQAGGGRVPHRAGRAAGHRRRRRRRRDASSSSTSAACDR